MCIISHVHILSALLTFLSSWHQWSEEGPLREGASFIIGWVFKGNGSWDMDISFFIIKNRLLSVCWQFWNFCVLIVKKIKCEVIACFCETTYKIWKSFQGPASKSLLQHPESHLLLSKLVAKPGCDSVSCSVRRPLTCSSWLVFPASNERWTPGQTDQWQRIR